MYTTVFYSVTRNPSSGSLVLSEAGSLDRAKAALERRKKAQAQESEMNQVSGRVEVTRVNPDNLIAELLKNTNLEQSDETAESTFIFIKQMPPTVHITNASVCM